MLFINIDPLAFGMAGVALLLSLISLLIIVLYLRKLAQAAMHLASAFHMVLETHGYFEDEDDDDDEDSGVDDDTGDDPPGDPHATAPLPVHNDLSEAIEEEAALSLIFHRADRDDLVLV